MANPKNATTTNYGRTYKWRDEVFDSVTTILNGGIPKPALKAWGEKLVAATAVAKREIWQQMDSDEAVDWLKRAPFRETDKAAAKGSDIHEWCEAYVLGQPIPDPPLLQQPYCDAFKAWLDQAKPEYEMTEASVYNRRHHYAGTLDAIAVCHGKRWLLDIKTGKGVYGEVSLQLAAYRAAEFIGVGDQEVPMVEVDGCAVLHVTPKGCDFIPVEAGPDEFRTFLYAQQIRHFLNNRAKEVLGAPITAEREALAS